MPAMEWGGMGGRGGGGSCHGKDIDGGGWRRVGLVDSLEDGADGGSGGENVVDDEPVAGRVGKGGGVVGVDTIQSLELFFPPGF